MMANKSKFKLSQSQTLQILASFLLAFMITGQMGCSTDTEAKGGTLAGAGIGGLALAAAGTTPQARLLLGATGALVGGAIGNQVVDKPAQEAKYKKDVQLAADQAKAAEYAKFQAQQELQEQRLYQQWKQQQAQVAVQASQPRY